MHRFFVLLLVFSLGCERPGSRGGKYNYGKKSDDGVNDWRVLVEVEKASLGSVSNELITHGTLESEAMADITPEAGGVVTDILVEEGDSVNRGQVLAILSNPSLEAGSDRAQVELKQAQNPKNRTA